VDCQWFSVYPGSVGRISGGTLNLRGGNEPLPDRGDGGFLDFVGRAGSLTAPNKSAAYLEGKILAGILRIDGQVLTQADQVVNGRAFVVSGTTLTLVPVDPFRADNPVPADGTPGVATTVTLAWELPAEATGCNVYFGTDSEVTQNPKVISNALQTAYSPAQPLEPNTTYYWRVDVLVGFEIHTGRVWRFTTGAVLNHTLVAHWDLEEGSGTQTTAAVGAPQANGTLHGADWVTTDLAPVPEGTTAALRFDAAADDYVGTGFPGVTGTAARTVAAWIKADPAQPENATFISWGSAGNTNRYSFRLNGTSQGTPYALRLEIQSTYAIAQTPLNDGQWHHVAVVHEAGATIGQVRFYVEGVPETGFSGQGTDAVIDTGTDSNVVLGSSFHSIGSYGFNGMLDDVRIYDYALSAEEIEDLYLGTIARAVRPVPAVESTHVDPAGPLAWDVINGTAPTCRVFIGTTPACDEVVDGQDVGSARVFDPAPGLLGYGQVYFWRVDVADEGQTTTGHVWSFRTGGVATDPVPADGTTADPAVRRIAWAGDDLADSYDVYFGLGDQTLVFVGNTHGTVMAFGDLAAALSLVRLPGETTFQWRVDCRDVDGELLTTGPIWRFTTPAESMDRFGVVENFDGYADTAALLDAWQVAGAGTIELDDPTQVMICRYTATGQPFSATLVHRIDPPADWVYDDWRSLEVALRGDVANLPVPIALRLSDGGTTAAVPLPPDALGTGMTWTTARIPLAAFSGVDLSHVTELAIVLGDGSAAEGTGVLYVNDIIAYPARCLRTYPVAGDLNGDCAIDLIDLRLFMADWLDHDYVVAAEPAPTGRLRAWYRLDETDGIIAADDSGHGFDAAVDPPDGPAPWYAAGWSGGCVRLTGTGRLVLPAAVFETVTDSVTLAFWVRGRPGDVGTEVSEASFESGPVPIEAHAWDRLCWPIHPPDAYGGTWNHYAFVKDGPGGSATIYHNGRIVATGPAGAGLDGPTAGPTVLEAAFSEDSFVLVDDLRIYDTALTQAQVVSLAVGPDGQIVQPIVPVVSRADVNGDGVVDLHDMAHIGRGWLGWFGWPEP